MQKVPRDFLIWNSKAFVGSLNLLFSQEQDEAIFWILHSKSHAWKGTKHIAQYVDSFDFNFPTSFSSCQPFLHLCTQWKQAKEILVLLFFENRILERETLKLDFHRESRKLFPREFPNISNQEKVCYRACDCEQPFSILNFKFSIGLPTRSPVH